MCKAAQLSPCVRLWSDLSRYRAQQLRATPTYCMCSVLCSTVPQATSCAFLPGPLCMLAATPRWVPAAAAAPPACSQTAAAPLLLTAWRMTQHWGWGQPRQGPGSLGRWQEHNNTDWYKCWCVVGYYRTLMEVTGKILEVPKSGVTGVGRHPSWSLGGACRGRQQDTVQRTLLHTFETFLEIPEIPADMSD